MNAGCPDDGCLVEHNEITRAGPCCVRIFLFLDIPSSCKVGIRVEIELERFLLVDSVVRAADAFGAVIVVKTGFKISCDMLNGDFVDLAWIVAVARDLINRVRDVRARVVCEELKHAN